MAELSYTTADLDTVNHEVLAHAKKCGASAVAVNCSEGYGISVNVRQLQPETIESMRDKDLSVTVYVGQRRGHASSSDFSVASIRKTVEAALDIARFTAEDDCAGLPDQDRLATAAQSSRNLELSHPWSITSEGALALAKAAEKAALKTDPAIANSEGAGVSTYHGQFRSANSLGFVGGYPYTRHSIGVSPIAKSNNPAQGMQREGWYSSDRRAERLADPIALGQYAAQRALSRLGARRVPTCKVPVLFEAPVAAGLLGHFVQAVSGGALYRRSSFLLDSLGKQVFPQHIDISEDPFTASAMGSSPFDDEGIATLARDVVQAGQVKGYFLSTYSARKLKMQTTGNAGGSHNLTFSSRNTRPLDDLPAMLRRLHRGLFVTELMGQGVNYVNGDYSRGASGYWVENGEIQYPVEEITIAGSLKDMFMGIDSIGSDVIVRGTKTTGSIIVEQMSIAGS